MADPTFESADEVPRNLSFDLAEQAGVQIARIDVRWADVVGSSPPTDPTNPGSAAYDFSRIDAAVAAAAQRGFEVMLTIYRAPSWAEGPGRQSSAPAGTWLPDPAAFGAFGRALASRYSGAFIPPGGGAPLPRVERYQGWNEPNLFTFLNPQYEDHTPVAPQHYRSMLNAFYAEVKAVDQRNTVITAGTGPFGSEPGSNRTRPLAFWRDVLCLTRSEGGLAPTACPEKASFDAFAHHPISTSGAPSGAAFHEDDVTIGDFADVRATLRAAERNGTIATSGRHPVWATELWWESRPPTDSGVPLKRQAQWLQEGLYLLWKQGAEVAINYRVRDGVPNPNDEFPRTGTGLYFIDGKPKPAATAFAFPFVTQKKGKRKKQLKAWGKAPRSGRLKIERKERRGWKRVESVRVAAGEIFTENLKVGGGRLRASVGDEESLIWKQR